MAKSTATKKTRKSTTTTHAKKTRTKKWSKHVTETSDAMDLEEGVFTGSDPAKIAQSLKRSVKHSHRRKGTPYQSAMSMLNFYINRGGKNLTASKKKVLEDAKDELKKVFNKDDEK